MTWGILSPGLVPTCVVLANMPSFDSFLTDQAIGTMSAVPRETYDRDGNVRVQQVKLAILRCIFNSLWSVPGIWRSWQVWDASVDPIQDGGRRHWQEGLQHPAAEIRLQRYYQVCVLLCDDWIKRKLIWHEILQGPRRSRARANHVCHLRGPRGNRLRERYIECRPASMN